MTALAAFFNDPRLICYTDAQRAKLLRIVALVQQIGEGNRLQMRLVTWARNLRVSLARLPVLLSAFAQDGALRVEEGLVEVADWLLRLFEDQATDGVSPLVRQDVAPLADSARPPSRQPAYARVYKQDWRARQRDTEQPQEVTPAFSDKPSDISDIPSDTELETAFSISTAVESVRNFEPFAQKPGDIVRTDVRTDEEAIAKLAEASFHVHERAKLASAKLRSSPAKYPNNRLFPSEAEVHQLLKAGYSCAEVSAAIAKAQATNSVLQGGGVGEWVKYLTPKLHEMQPKPQTGRLDLLVMSSEPPPKTEAKPPRTDTPKQETLHSPGAVTPRNLRELTPYKREQEGAG